MRARLISLLVIAASHAVYADNATIPHAFTANTPAKADEVNANFSAVKSSIDDNDARITTNTTSISNVSTATTVNASAITANAAAISTNTTAIDQNTNAIGLNASDTAQNTAEIAANASDILTHSVDISSIQTDVAANTAAIAGLGSVYVKANGQPIGLLVAGSAGFIGGNSDPRPLTVLSDTDYLFDIDKDGNLHDGFTLYYESADCSGQAYLAGPGAANAQINAYYAAQGYVLKSPDSADPVTAYYLASNTPTLAANRSMYSIRNSGGCSSTFNSVYGYPILPNDPAITAVSEASFAKPITIGR